VPHQVLPRWIPLLGGRPIPPLAAVIPAALGAAFLMTGASITRQFEFLQRVWVNGDFAGLGAVKDPLIAANDGTGIFTIPAQTVAPAGEGLPRLVTIRAGEDCFLPGIRALPWTAEGQ
jgi:hypothetical protein